MHSTYVKMAMDRQRAELRNRKNRRLRTAMAFRNKLKDCCRKITAFFFTQVHIIWLFFSILNPWKCKWFCWRMFRLEFVDLLSVTQLSALLCSSPWKRKPNIHWHKKWLFDVDPASTTCGTVTKIMNNNIFIHRFIWIFIIDSYSSPECPELRPMATGRQSHRFRVIPIKNNSNCIDEFWNNLLVLTNIRYQAQMVRHIRRGYDGTDENPLLMRWTIPAALMYCITIYTTIGNNNPVNIRHFLQFILKRNANEMAAHGVIWIKVDFRSRKKKVVGMADGGWSVANFVRPHHRQPDRKWHVKR